MTQLPQNLSYIPALIAGKKTKTSLAKLFIDGKLQFWHNGLLWKKKMIFFFFGHNKKKKFKITQQ